MPITFPVVAGGQTAQAVAGGSTVNCQAPAGYTAVFDDFAIIYVVGRPTDTSNPTTPAGWTLRSAVSIEVGANDLRIVTFWRRLDGTETFPIGVTYPAAWGGATGGTAVQMAIYRGVDHTNTFDVADVIGSLAAAAPGTWAPPAITTITPHAWVISFVGTPDANDLDLNTSNGFTLRMGGPTYDSVTGGNMACGVADLDKLTPGLVVMPEWVQQALEPDEYAGITMALRPADPNDPIQSLRPNETVDATGWSIVGGSPSHHAALADEDPATGSKINYPSNAPLKIGLDDHGTPGAGDIKLIIDVEQIGPS